MVRCLIALLILIYSVPSSAEETIKFKFDNIDIVSWHMDYMQQYKDTKIVSSHKELYKALGTVS